MPMGPPPKGPRLWLEPGRWEGGRQRPSKWVIRDHGRKKIGTGYGENDLQLAEAALARYVAQRHPDAQLGAISRHYLYFITASPVGYPIKIGVTSHQRLRLSTLQTASPYPLEVLAMLGVNDRAIERDFHARFSVDRLQGEWFARTQPLLTAISELIATYGLRDTPATPES